MGSLREKMLEEEHSRELQRLQRSPDQPVLSFTETVSFGNRTITRTAAATMMANGHPDELMEFLKRSVREESVASPVQQSSAGCSSEPFPSHGRGAKHQQFAADDESSSSPTP